MQYIIPNESAMLSFAADIASTLKAGNVVFLEGDLGAGKTRFVKEFCLSKGSEDPISSPTFSLVNEYIN